MRWSAVAITLGGLAAAAGLRAQGPAEALVPSSPHRVLGVGRLLESWYLIEDDKPLLAEVEGPGLLELTLRRAIYQGEPPVQPTSVRVSLDGEVQPPITFRRAREEKLRFVDEPRFVPSAPREAKLAIPLGSHRVVLELGSDTQAVAVALRFRKASARAVVPGVSPEELPPLEPIPPPDPLAASGAGAIPEPAAPLEPPPATLTPVQPPPADLAPAAPPAEPAPAAPPSEPAPAAPAPAPPALVAETPASAPGPTAALAGPAPRVATFDVGLGLSTTFVGLGSPSPALRLGARYIPPWFDGQLRLGADLAVARYAVRSAGDDPPALDASNWVVPLLAIAALAPTLPTRWVELELGAGVGLAANAASLRYRGVDSSSAGVGGAAALFAEVAVPLGPVAACARLQLDAVSASNDIFRRFNYLGSSALLGARWWF